MEILLLGTAAAEAWPAPFCRCRACKDARQQRGKNIRTRSGALIDGILKVDFGPDTTTQLQREGRDIGSLTSLVFTHAHDDHFTPAELQYRKSMFYADEPPAPLHVYGNAEVMDVLEGLYPDPAVLNATFHQPLREFAPVTIKCESDILPLTADHSAGALILRITRNGKSLLYGHDTGRLPEQSVQALAGKPLDLALFDCTYGANDGKAGLHMGLPDLVDTIGRLRRVGAVNDGTRLVATHISHHSGLLHDDLSNRLRPHGIEAAYDGLIINL